MDTPFKKVVLDLICFIHPPSEQGSCYILTPIVELCHPIYPDPILIIILAPKQYRRGADRSCTAGWACQRRSRATWVLNRWSFQKTGKPKKQTKIGISIKSVFKWRVRDCFAFNELLIRVYYKRRKNQGKTEEIMLEFVSIFDTARSLPNVIGDVKMEGFDSTDSPELAFIRPVSYVP